MTVAALFVTPGSVYKSMPGVEAFDIDRDARTFDLATPVVAHPPCRAWCKLSHFAKPRADERDLAHWAVHVVRHCGGVLEHPITSRLWREIGCLTPGVRDVHGGVLLTVRQSWWGHRAEKATGIYVVGPLPALPDYTPEPLRPCGGAVQNMGAAERMRTPAAFAGWLVSAARACA